jgi:predicted acyl esterase
VPGIIKPGLAIRIGSAIKEINRRRLAVLAASRRQRSGRSRAAIRVRTTQFSNSLRLRGSREHPEFGAWWASLNRRIDDIEVPPLVCGSFSDHNLHSQGSINGFRRIASAHK